MYLCYPLVQIILQVGGPEFGFPHSLLPRSLEPSPYEESEVHDSFHQLIQEQSLRVAEEGLELLPLGLGKPRPAL
jgi:hypothetical protein